MPYLWKVWDYGRDDWDLTASGDIARRVCENGPNHDIPNNRLPRLVSWGENNAD